MWNLSPEAWRRLSGSVESVSYEKKIFFNLRDQKKFAEYNAYNAEYNAYKFKILILWIAVIIKWYFLIILLSYQIKIVLSN
jgi:hypothetical protein